MISHSRKRPHLVFPKRKSKGLSCDDVSPQYKSAKLCSHVVAAAHHNKELDSFVASYQTLKAVPNITKLTTSTMPRGRGRKGSKATTKQKAAVPVQDRIELYLISTGKDAASLHASMQIQVSASSDAEVSVSPVCNTPSFYGQGVNSATYSWFSNPSYYSSPTVFPSPYPPMSTSAYFFTYHEYSRH